MIDLRTYVRNYKGYVAVGAFTLVVLLVTIVSLFGRAPEPEPVLVEEPVLEIQPLGPAVERRVIGTSVEQRDIEAVTFGNGGTHLLFVGGIHGGYEWNSVLLAYELIDYLEEDATRVPDNVTVTVVPSANPDGLYAVLQMEGRFGAADVDVLEAENGTGRFNANNVDLNRNFDCKWQPESTWRGATVSAGTAAFSEPETRALRDLVDTIQPRAAVFFHSAANAVYASECTEGILLETLGIMNAYAIASGYKPVESFDHYKITGDAEGWLASLGIPAVTVELSDHDSVEWEQNKRGILALFEYYSAASQ